LPWDLGEVALDEGFFSVPLGGLAVFVVAACAAAAMSDTELLSPGTELASSGDPTA